MHFKRILAGLAALLCVSACSGPDVRPIGFVDLQYPYDVAFASLDSGRIAYVDVGPEVPGKAVGTVLLLHGWRGDLRRWSKVMPFLSRTHRVIAMDFPGYGKSAKEDGVSYGIPLFARAAFELLGHLGIDRAVWAGHSMGGQVAVHAALADPDRVSKLVLVDSSGIAPSPQRFELMISEDRLADPGYQAIVRMIRHVSYEEPDNAEAAARELYGLTQGPEYRAHARAALLAHRSMATEDIYYEVAKIQTPTLIVWGAADPIFPAATALEFNERIAGSLVAFIPECGHLPPVEKPDAFNRVIGEFLGIADLPELKSPYPSEDPAESKDAWSWLY